MNAREKSVQQEYLVEEEKFLKEIEKNLQEHINRLKVEELSLLKLISNANQSDVSTQRGLFFKLLFRLHTLFLPN